MNIPQEAVEAAASAIDFNHDWTYEGDGIYCMDCGARWEGYVPRKYSAQHSAVQRHQAQLALAAALPAIEKEIRAQVAAELRGELPVQLAETAGSATGWLSDVQYLNPNADEDQEFINFAGDNGYPLGSIDISHIAEHAARIAEGAGE